MESFPVSQIEERENRPEGILSDSQADARRVLSTLDLGPSEVTDVYGNMLRGVIQEYSEIERLSPDDKFSRERRQALANRTAAVVFMGLHQAQARGISGEDYITDLQVKFTGR